jgi:hypothetical protein
MIIKLKRGTHHLDGTFYRRFECGRDKDHKGAKS